MIFRIFLFNFCALLILINGSNAIGECECFNEGKCVITPPLNETKCQCNTNYFGEHCELTYCSQTEINQCKNEGNCVKNTLTNIEFCQCKSNYTGALCEIPLCLNYCYNYGKCILNSNQILTCLCNQRFSGNRCQFDKCQAYKEKCTADCFMDYEDSECKCKCDKDCDKKYCNNNGVCYNNEESLACRCKPGYSSAVCSINDCEGYCFNGGTCSINKETNDIYCICPEGYTERRCSKLQPSEKKVVPLTYRTTRIIIYGLTIALFICLCIAGAYMAIQNDLFNRIFSKKFRFSNGSNNETHSSESQTRRSFPFIRNNFSFKKLDDEQIITQNEVNTNEQA